MDTLRIFTCIHGRHKLTRAFFKQLAYLREETGYSLPVTFGYTSEEDLKNVADLLTKNCQPVQAKNEPLSFKHNKAMDAWVKEKTESHILHLGSDDFCTVDYLLFLHQNLCDYGGVQQLYFYNKPKRQAAIKQYFTNDQVMGAGRLYSRKAVTRAMGKRYRLKMHYYGNKKGDIFYIPKLLGSYMKYDGYFEELNDDAEQCALWMHPANKGLDNMSHDVLMKLGVKSTVFDKHFDKPQIVDVKGYGNVTDWERVNKHSIPTKEPKKIIKVDIEA